LAENQALFSEGLAGLARVSKTLLRVSAILSVALLAANTLLESYWPEALCALGRASLCAESALRAYRKSDFSRYYRYSEKSCRGGSATGCSNVGVAYEQGLGVQKDYARARGYYETACSKQSAIACRNLGNLHLWGFGVPRDRTLALRYLKQACDANLGEGCNDQARALPHAADGDSEPAHAERRALYARACDAGNQFGCANLASTLAHLQSPTSAEAARAAELASKGCLLEHPYSCSVFGHLLENGIGTGRNLPAARERYQFACDHEEATGCLALGRILALGVGGVAVDLAGAQHAFERACQLDEARACDLLATTTKSDPSLSESEREKKSAAYTVRAEALRRASPYTDD